MKQLALIISVFFVCITAAQEQTLKTVEVAKFTKIEEGRYIVMNPVYQYITENYNPTSGKEEIPEKGARNCGFTQTFENGLTYTKRNCGDAFLENGEVLTIPNADRQSVIAWVESLNEIFGAYNDNMWNFDQTEYRPITGGPGGFFRILTDNEATKVLVMSGC